MFGAMRRPPKQREFKRHFCEMWTEFPLPTIPYDEPRMLFYTGNIPNE